MEYIGPIGTLAYKLYTSVYLQLYPLRLDVKLSTFYLLVGLQEVTISVAIVEDLGIGLRQPLLVKGPSRLVIVVKFLLIVISVQVGNILELGDLYVVRPSRVELYILLLLYESKRLYLILVYIDVSIPLAEIQTFVLVVRPALGLLFSEPSLLLYLLVLVLQVIESVAREVQHIVVSQPLLPASYIYKRVVKLENLFLKYVDKLLYLLNLVSRLVYSLPGLFVLLLGTFQLAIDLCELLSEVASLLLKEHRVRPLMLVVVVLCLLLSIVVLDYRDPLGLRYSLQVGQQTYIRPQQLFLPLQGRGSVIRG